MEIRRDRDSYFREMLVLLFINSPRQIQLYAEGYLWKYKHVLDWQFQKLFFYKSEANLLIFTCRNEITKIANLFLLVLSGTIELSKIQMLMYLTYTSAVKQMTNKVVGVFLRYVTTGM